MTRESIKIRSWTAWTFTVWSLILFMNSCRPDEPEYRVEVETGSILEVGSSSCMAEGEILSIGESGISSYGFVWSEQAGSVLENGLYNDLGETYVAGTFTYRITGLTANTTYYVKAYASGGGETVYGTERSFTTGELAIPSVTTFTVYDITSNTGFSGGTVTDDGGGEVRVQGVCWSTGRFPDLADPHTDEGGGTSSFESYMSGLEPYTVYHVRAYATNDAGTGYGQEVAFQTYWDNSPVLDREGNEYPTVQIGDQVWTAVNLRSTRYADGTPITLVSGDSEWADLEVDARAYCFYEPEPDLLVTYGALYTWAAAVNGAGPADPGTAPVQGVCPDGWHLPDEEEWQDLELELGMSWLVVGDYDWRGFDEGGMLKLPGTEFWNEPNELATNESGFSAAGAGRRKEDGSLSDIGNYTGFWTASAAGDTVALMRGLHTQRGDIRRITVSWKEGYSVRCVKDR